MVNFSEQFDFDLLVQNLPIGVMFIDHEKVIRNINNKIVEIFGNIANKNLHESIIRIYKPNLIKKVDEVLRTGLDNSNTMSPLEKKGRISFLNTFYYPVRNDNNKIDGVLVIILDLGENGVWQKEFNLLFENVPAYISIVDRSNKIVRANQRYRDTFGNIYGIFYVDPLKRKIDQYVNATSLTFENGLENTDTVSVPALSKERVNLIVTTLPFTSKDGIVNLVIEIATDITEINKLQDQIYNAHDFYTNLIESSADGIMAVDNKGKIQIINYAAKKILGFDGNKKPSASKVKEMIPKEIFGLSDSEGVIVADYDTYIRDNNNDSVPLRFNSYVVMKKRKSVGVVTFFQDLRKIKKLERRIYDAENLAFMSIVQKMKPSIEYVQSKQKQLIESIEKILESGESVDIKLKKWNMIKIQLQFISKIIDSFIVSSDLQENQKSMSSIKDLVAVVSSEFIELFKCMEIDFDIEYNLNNSMFEIDYISLERLLFILIMNSFEAVRDTNNAKITILVENSNSHINIEIKDNGKQLSKILDSKSYTLRGFENLKMGIYTSYSLASKLKADFLISKDSDDQNTTSLTFKV